jgi:hypothetical protein
LKVAGYHGVSADLDGKAVRQVFKTVFYPILAMLIGPAGVFIFSAKKRPPHTSGNTVVNLGYPFDDSLPSGDGHANTSLNLMAWNSLTKRYKEEKNKFGCP